MIRPPPAAALLACLSACPVTGDDDVDVPALDDDDDAPWQGCRAEPPPADRDRVVLVSHPFAPGGGTEWAVLSLSVAGELEDTGQRLEAGNAPWGEVVFTPDGAIALAANDNGTISVFSVEDGEVSVVEAGISGFYASRVVVEPGGEVAWVVDGNWANNGGGLYRVPIDCDAPLLGTPERVVESKLAADLLLDPARDDRGMLVALEVEGTATGDDAALLPWPPGDAPGTGADAFGDDEAWVADATLTQDGRFALLGDNSAFSGIPNRVAVIELAEGGLLPGPVLPDVYDPVALVASPFNDAVLVVSGYGDAIFAIAYDAGLGTFEDLGEPDYEGASPQLPGAASVVSRGALAGLILVAENQGVRGMRFDGQGGVLDLGLLVEGDGNVAITGALGVAP